MCGLVAALDRKIRRQVLPLDEMSRQLGRRGPDSVGSLQYGPISLAHTRLSIIDLAGGGQPIFNEDRSVACVLNGEIYNYLDLRSQLVELGHRFSTNSDTEVVVHLYEEMGEALFEKLRGMFALVVADLARSRLLVGRDRMGEKPLYFVDSSEGLICASEIKALLCCPGLAREVDSASVRDYLQLGYIPAPHSIFCGIRKLPPAHYLDVQLSGTTQSRYWKPIASTVSETPLEQQIEMIRERMSSAVRGQLIADVPVGIFLSGGLDSSAVTAFAAMASSQPVRTFAVGFGSAISELPFAREVASIYGTQHTELQVEQDIVSTLGEVARYFDEPFADSSSLPMYLICKEARRHVKVVLSGDGGDELFAGYDGYLNQIGWSSVRGLRGVVRGLLALRGVPGAGQLISRLYPLPMSSGGYTQWVGLRSTRSAAEAHRLLSKDMSASTERDPWAESIGPWSSDPVSQAFGFDMNTYLPDDLLKKVDMASMACGLETRAPLLDQELVEAMLGIGPLRRLRGFRTKGLMRDVLEPLLPPAILNRPKQGFGAPLVEWLTGPLKDHFNETVRGGASMFEFLDEELVLEECQRSWETLRSDWRSPMKLWSVLMLEEWAQRYLTV